VTTPLNEYLHHMVVLMLVNFCNRSYFKAMGLICVAPYQLFNIYNDQVCVHIYAKRTLLLGLGLWNPGVD